MEIKPIDQIWTTDGVHVVQFKIYDPHQVRQLEADYKEAIEALKMVQIGMILLKAVTEEKTRAYYNIEDAFMNSKDIKIIEKAYGESWDDIRRSHD